MKYQIELEDTDVWFVYGLLEGQLEKMKSMNQTDMIKEATVITNRVMKELHNQMKSFDDEISK